MPTFLSDPPQLMYTVLAAVILVTGAVWFNRRSKAALAVFLGVLGFALLLLLLDYSFESGREEAVRRAQAMVHAADAKNPEAFVEHLAETVDFPSESGPREPVKRDTLKTHAFWGMLRQFNVRVVGWDYAEVESNDANKVEIGFMAKGEADGKPFPVYIRATFTRQADGKLKLSAFRTLNPVNRTEPIAIPFLR
ncbi:MAG: hypothetical protein K8U57_06525 [Planctomycetes bacterium]|nr:hypothetical protein [Planctomycetota bacterium]